MSAALAGRSISISTGSCEVALKAAVIPLTEVCGPSRPSVGNGQLLEGILSEARLRAMTSVEES